MQKKFRIIISLLIISIIMFFTYNISELYEEVADNQHNKLISELSIVSNGFTTWIASKMINLETMKEVVENFSYDEVVRNQTKNPLLNINNNDPNISQIYIGFSDGGFVTGGEWIPPDDYDPRTRPWYESAVEAGHTIISPVYIDRETNDKTVTISSPLYLENTFVGVISVDVFLNTIHTYLVENLPNEMSYIYILDSDGRMLIHTKDPSFVGVNIYTDIDRDDLWLYFEEVKKTDSIVKMEYVIDNEDIRGTMQKIEKLDWYIGISSIENKGLYLLQNIEKTNLLFNFLSVCIIGILVVLVIKIRNDLDKKNKLLVNDNERDFLTGIYNRRYFNIKMDEIWKNKSETNIISLLMLDIDFFKVYNDTYGHIAGDQALKTVTSIIAKQIREEDVFVRYGGEEFIIVLEQVTSTQASEIAAKLVTAVYKGNIENKVTPNNRITISVGVASTSPDHKISSQEFINMADSALYQAKAKGKNMYVISQD